MQYILFLIGAVILFALFVTRMLLNSLKQNDREQIAELIQEVEYEKAQTQLYDIENHQLQHQRKRIDQKLLHIRLDLLNTEDDLKDVIPRLLN
jgi:septal ring factor EnvC (AmiA/AmiB activator)